MLTTSQQYQLLKLDFQEEQNQELYKIRTLHLVKVLYLHVHQVEKHLLENLDYK